MKEKIDSDEIKEIDELIASLSKQTTENEEVIADYTEEPLVIPVYEDIDKIEDNEDIIEAYNEDALTVDETLEAAYVENDLTDTMEEKVNDMPDEEDEQQEPIELKDSKNIRFKKSGKRMMIFSSLFMPALIVMLVIGSHSNGLITSNMFRIISFTLGFLLGLFICGLVLYILNFKVALSKKTPEWLAAIYMTFMGLYILGCTGFLFVLYGPNDTFREWYITTAMGTEEYQHYARWFYNEQQIEEVLNRNNSE